MQPGGHITNGEEYIGEASQGDDVSEKRKVLAPNPKSILQWVVRDIIGLSKGKKHETSTYI
jgi:hypothetical protein